MGKAGSGYAEAVSDRNSNRLSGLSGTCRGGGTLLKTVARPRGAEQA